MINNPTWAGIRRHTRSFATLKSLPCDVFLGPRAIFRYGSQGTEDVVNQPNPFIDPAGYKRYIARWEKSHLDKSRRSGLRANEIVPSGSGMKFDLNG